MNDALTISFTCSNPNTVLLLLVLYELLEDEKNLDLSNIVSPENYTWLTEEIKMRGTGIREE